ncbi:hypothetical protein C5Z25_07950 [Lactobacillus sp. CBA3605]|uniref:hypothetical protein n=1 Tax=Lactobacillus sp. CBA3605 TaxID=2099788 RepID=UPI000CFC23A4|nr:hypothetical protein [Lactobacillus sp. CBA3605]AVK61712.1 hypothetical protein C5Z25_07950 [Lactobacillus sp. CBA3605]
MLLDNNPRIKNIMAAKIVKVFYPQIIVQTETGHYLPVNISDQQRQDTIFWESVQDIWHAQLWVPIGRKFHQLLADDWLLPQRDELGLLN